MRFSLVLGTVGRTGQVQRFLASLAAQTYRSFELIIVDQNPDDRVVEVARPWQDRLPIRHLRSNPGLSRARNVGLRYVNGDVVAFPDDDCWYPPDLLDRVARILTAHPESAGLTGRSVDETGRPSMGRWATRAGPLTRFNIWHRGISITIFLRRTVIDRVGGFDEALGAGAPWGGAEELDYLLRALKAGFGLTYHPDVTVCHS
jgi:glycosyltransferase involved in cell wall biosynthesis